VTVAYAEWIGYMYADHAVVNSDAAWDQIMAVDINVGFGPGNSKTNLLFWAASQPAPPTGYEDVTYMIDFNTTIKSSCADNSACAAQGELRFYFLFPLTIIICLSSWFRFDRNVLSNWSAAIRNKPRLLSEGSISLG
jgi:hypothetical protein